jgi:peptidoglycan/xylan/chitin deacetylase (PgdA/CDA1 family)
VALSTAGSIRRRTPKRDLRLLYGHGMERQHVSRFRTLLRELRQRYEFVTLAEAVDLASSPRIPEGRYLAFSFDDGFRDNYELVAPALLDAGARCCFFVATNFIDCDDEYRRWFLTDRVCADLSKRPMTWAMLGELADAGFEVGAHTVDHLDLGKAPLAEAEGQMRASKKDIETRLGRECKWFAWPYGRAQHMPPAVLQMAIGLFDGVFSAERSTTLRSPHSLVFNRDHFEPGWPRSHVRFFLSRAIRVVPAAGPAG